LTHYVRSGDFVLALLRDAQNVYDYGVRAGRASHYATDNQGHRLATNRRGVPILYPKLKSKFGDFVTYEDDTLAHVKTEFGFDVLQVAKGNTRLRVTTTSSGSRFRARCLIRRFNSLWGRIDFRAG